MRKGIFLLSLLLSFSVVAASYPTPEQPVGVQGYNKKSGAYVNPYYRAYPNTKSTNTYSLKGSGKSTYRAHRSRY